eukprot:12261-Eustigmatos_ZCMA.PRE.1
MQRLHHNAGVHDRTHRATYFSHPAAQYAIGHHGLWSTSLPLSVAHAFAVWLTWRCGLFALVLRAEVS